MSLSVSLPVIAVTRHRLLTAWSSLGHRLAQNENLADALDHVTRKARLAKAWNVWVGMMEDMMLLELAACI